MVESLLIVAAVLQCIALVYGLYLLGRRKGAAGAWACLIGGMSSMLVWRLVMVSGVTPPAFFNPLIAIWGSTFMVAAMFLFGREVAARQRAEAERDELLNSERAARIEAERAGQAKDEFLATLSHELRSPLAAILGWCAVLLRAPGSVADVERAIRTIKRNARAQSRLVDDLLDMTRMRAGSLRLSVATIPLDVPARAAVQAARPLADEKSLQLQLLVEKDAPLVAGDADRLRQVVTNLVENAIKFTPPGGTVSVSIRAANGQAELSVADTGDGIDPDFLPHVFARFRQADSSTTRRHGGLGLGLSIVDYLVRMHGGTVRAESQGIGNGATFTMMLPLATAAADPIDDLQRLRTSLPLIGRPLADVRVLLVDDEEDVRTATQRLLEHQGATVEALDSGRAIKDWLVRYRPHILLFDIGMPGEDGYSLIRRVRQLPTDEGGSTPAISLTAHARNEDRDRALTAGFTEHLPKPIDIPQLVSAIRALARTESASLREATT
jgi:signal transduction histidine kinase/ActR/RegA family two-component response regulator